MNKKLKLQFILFIFFPLVLIFSSASASTSSTDFLSRQKIFYKVMELSNAEIKTLNENLNNLRIDNKDYAQKREEFLKKLSEFEIYNKEVKEKISKTETLEDLKNLAVDFKNWREQTYNPQVQIMIDFSLIFKQQEILATTTERFEKISKDVKKLTNLGAEQKQQLNSLLETAKEKLNSANDFFQKAKIELDDYLFNSSTELATTTSTENTTSNLATTTESIEIKKQFNHFECQELIKKSFETIKEIYEIFLKMSDLVKAT